MLRSVEVNWRGANRDGADVGIRRRRGMVGVARRIGGVVTVAVTGGGGGGGGGVVVVVRCHGDGDEEGVSVSRVCDVTVYSPRPKRVNPMESLLHVTKCLKTIHNFFC